MARGSHQLGRGNLLLVQQNLELASLVDVIARVQSADTRLGWQLFGRSGALAAWLVLMVVTLVEVVAIAAAAVMVAAGCLSWRAGESYVMLGAKRKDCHRDQKHCGGTAGPEAVLVLAELSGHDID